MSPETNLQTLLSNVNEARANVEKVKAQVEKEARTSAASRMVDLARKGGAERALEQAMEVLQKGRTYVNGTWIFDLPQDYDRYIVDWIFCLSLAQNANLACSDISFAFVEHGGNAQVVTTHPIAQAIHERFKPNGEMTITPEGTCWVGSLHKESLQALLLGLTRGPMSGD